MIRATLSLLGVLLSVSANAMEDAVLVDDERRQFREQMLLGQVRYFSAVGDHYQALQAVSDNELFSDRQLRQRLRTDEGGGQDGHSLASIELAYRLNQRAGNAVRAVLDASVELDRRNRAAYELAQIYYRKQDYEYARFALELIRGEIEDGLQDDARYLGAMVDARSGEVERAIRVLSELKDDERHFGFAGFNLAHLLMQAGEVQAALRLFGEISQLESEDIAISALAEKSRIVLGYHFMAADDHAATIEHLSRVSLDGVFTNTALVGLAWTHMKSGDEQAALVAWTHLNKRRPVDAAVLESYVAIPFLYSKLGLHSKAANHYQQAIDKLIEYQDALRLTRAIVDRGDIIPVGEDAGERDASIVDELIVDLLASKEYRESWYNYRDLVEMSKVIDRRRASLDEIAGLLAARDSELAPSMEATGESLDSLRARLQGARDQSTELAPLDEGTLRLLEDIEMRLGLIDASSASSADFQEFQLPVTGLIERTDRFREALDNLRQRQGEHLKRIADIALERRIALIEHYTVTARYEMAKSYDILAEREKQR